RRDPTPGEISSSDPSELRSRLGPAGDLSLRYRIQTSVPPNWFPLIPVRLDKARGDIALLRGTMLSSGTDGDRTIQPLGRILRPSSLGDHPMSIREEEIPRSGVRVARALLRTRWVDGSTHVWIARRKFAGLGE